MSHYLHIPRTYAKKKHIPAARIQKGTLLCVLLLGKSASLAENLLDIHLMGWNGFESKEGVQFSDTPLFEFEFGE